MDGLIHISQMADHRVEKPGDVVSEGDKIDVKITDVDMENKKISLSIRALQEVPADGEEPEEEAPEEAGAPAAEGVSAEGEAPETEE